jgi:hypothetical protein
MNSSGAVIILSWTSCLPHCTNILLRVYPLLGNDPVNTLQQQRGRFLCGPSRDHWYAMVL